MSAIMGIDPSSANAKKLLVNASGRDYSVSKYGKSNKIIATVPSNYLTFRKFNIPFRDRKKINDIIKEDLSQTLLFYENAVWDFTFGPDNEVFVAITSKDTINKLIKQIGVKPHIFDAEPYALVRAASVCGHNEGLIIDFGSEKTVFAGFKSGRLNFCKVLLKSGNNLINEFASKNNVTEKEALSVIKKEGLKNAFTLSFFRSMMEIAFPPGIKPEYSKILICGEFAEIPYLDEFLKEASKLEVKKLDLADKILDNSNLIAFGAAIKNTAHGVLAHGVLAHGLLDAHTHEYGVNLAPYKIEENEPYKKWVILLLIPLLLLLVSVKYKETVLSSRVNNINKAMVKILKKDFPDIKNTAYPLSQYQSMMQKYGSQYPGGDNVLDILSKISACIVSAVKVDSIDISEKNISISGKTDSIKTVEGLKQALSQSFKNVDIAEVKNLKDESRFTIKMEI